MFKIIGCILCILCVASCTTAQFELCVCGATVVDGSGAAPMVLDVGIHNGMISEVGKIKVAACDTVVQAQGKILAPGFIDLHAHGDPLKQAGFQNFLAMGVTTIVLGQDGTDVAHDFTGEQAFGQWVGLVQKTNLDINIIPLMGHGSLLSKFNSDTLTMFNYMDHAMNAGAWGMSMGLEYMPALQTTTEELIPIAQKLGEQQAILMAHIRSEDDDQIESAITEMKKLSQYTPAHISHLKVVYGKGKERANDVLNMIYNTPEKYPLTADLYPYLASYTGIGIIFPKWAKTNADFKQAKKNKPAALRSYLTKRLEQRNGAAATLICTGPYTGMTLAAVSKKLKQSPEDVLMEWGPQSASGAYFVMDSALQYHLAVDDRVAFCTDGSPTMRHPRGYGTYAKILGQYVRDEQKLSVETAIKKMTSLPAQILGLKKRGSIKKGYIADLVMFDLQKIKANANYVSPKNLAEGFEAVWIGGRLVWNGSEKVHADAGSLLLKHKT